MKVKELQKTVNIVWSPKNQSSIYLAAGTAAQQFDSNANSTLEIYAPNFCDASIDLELKASVPSQNRFQKLIWTPVTTGAGNNGLIVGGCEGGHIELYSTSKMLANEDSLVSRQHKHTGAVSGLDFNPFQNNLLASCASESEIFIWDLNNPTTHMNPGAKTQPLEDVKNVAWNRQVQHILASVFSSRCVIWDLRKSQQIIKLSDNQSRVRWHSIQWHPEAATQVWLASEDDQAPVVQLWDLRYATAPAKTYQIHQRGVLGMSWCLHDTDIMVSCGKDNRIYAWNPNTESPEGEILSEVATTASWYSDVQCCPRNPALIASSSLDGNVSIYSLFGGTQQVVQTANKIADSFPGMDQFAQAPISQQATQVVYHDLKHAPKWLKRSSCVAFGFGGKLLSFDCKSKDVNISQVTTEPELVQRANDLESSLANANYVEYCRQRADQMTDQNGRFLWYFIKANFEMDPKEELLNLLGYNKEDTFNKFAKYVKEDDLDLQQDVDQLTNRISTLTHSDSSEVECDQSTNCSTDNSHNLDNNAVFDDIATTPALKEFNHETAQSPKLQFKIPKGEHADSLITEALLTGNLEAAVELCLEAHQPTEALIIASTAGIDFLNKTQNRYLQQQQQSELSNVISALVTRDWLDFVNRCTVDSWKEALVATLKHSERNVVDICERLGDRLLVECENSLEYTRNAMLCYICAGSIDKLIIAWYQHKQLDQRNTKYKLNTIELQELAEVVMVMTKSLEQQGIALDFNGRSADFISEYAGLLAAQGALPVALGYISALVSGDQKMELEVLRERIYNTVNYKPSKVRNALGYTQHFRNQQPSAQFTNAYGQQKPRSSFSQINSLQSLQQTPLGYPPISKTAQSCQFTNNWQAQSPQTAIDPADQLPTNVFNSAQSATTPQSYTQPPKIETPLNTSQPPRPPSNASSHGGSSNIIGSSGPFHVRSKYVLDPSVAPASGTAGVYGNLYNPVPAPIPFGSAVQHSAPGSHMPINSPYNNQPFNANPLGTGHPVPSPALATQVYQPSLPQTYNSTSYLGATAPKSYLPGIAPIETTTTPPQNLLQNPTPPPGWNDPPAIKTSRAAKHSEPATAAAAITHPLFGVDPNKNGYMDPNQYQQPGGMPPPPVVNATNTYYNTATANTQQQNNNPTIITQQFPQQTNFQATLVPNQQQWNTQPQQQTIGCTEQPAPIQRQPEPPKPKAPLPEEFIYLQTVLNELKTQCLNVTADARTKRKFVDVAKRLENLYDCLRDGRLAHATIQYLNQIVQYIQIGDYTNALEMHTRIAFGNDFSQCAGFMPGLKVLLQSAMDLHVVLR